jgi:hypothetical protein
MRNVIAVIALAPAAIGLLAGIVRGYNLGPVPGLRWLFEPEYGLLVDEWGLRLLVDHKERWSIPWESIDRLEGTGLPEHLVIRSASDGVVLDLPRSLLKGRVAGTDHAVDVLDLIARRISQPRPPR